MFRPIAIRGKDASVLSTQFFGLTSGGAAKRGYRFPASRRREIIHRSFKRTDIVSPKLCDDIIQYLEPVLRQHKGCTLIDLNPGECLFSSKLHDYLQPKRHLLMEMDEAYYEPFIKPLLEKSGSTYSHTFLRHDDPRKNLTIWPEIKEMLDLPPALPYHDPEARKLNTNLLVIGNLIRQMGITAVENYPSLEYAQFMCQHLSQRAMQGDHYHDHGLARMLFWVPDSMKHRLIAPELPSYRGRLGATMDLFTDTWEVAGAVPINHVKMLAREEKGFTLRQRTGSIDKANQEVVRERAKEAGFVIPKGRKMQPENPGKEVDWNVPRRDPYAIDLADLQQLEEKVFEVGKRWESMLEWAPHMRKKNAPGGASSKRAASTRASLARASSDRPPSYRLMAEIAVREIIYPQCEPAVNRLRHFEVVDSDRTMVTFDYLLRVFNLEVNWKHIESLHLDPTPTQAAQLADLRTRIIALETAYRTSVQDWKGDTESFVDIILEDELALSPSTPAAPSTPLAHDRRTAEPLCIEPHETSPPTSAPALLCITPRSTNLDVPDIASRYETVELATHISKILFGSRTAPLPLVLDRMAINAGKDLVPQVGAITDPRRGGRLDPWRLRAHMVTGEMVEGLVRAWVEWPFRPAPWTTFGSSSKADMFAEAGEGPRRYLSEVEAGVKSKE